MGSQGETARQDTGAAPGEGTGGAPWWAPAVGLGACLAALVVVAVVALVRNMP